MEYHKVFRVWDRKSSRHDWRIIFHGEKERADALFVLYCNKLRAWGKWPQGQVGMDTATVACQRVLEKEDFQQSSNAPMLMTFIYG